MPYPLDESLRQAIRDHFKRDNLIWSEHWFIKVIQTSDRKYDIYWSVLALRDCGTDSCVPILKNLLSYPMRDVKCTSLLTIAHIAGHNETVFYAETLLNKDYREKVYAMWAIKDAADNRAIDSVLEYLLTNQSKWKNGAMPKDILPYALEYLSNFYDDDERLPKLFSEVTESWERISEVERTVLTKRIPYFSVFQKIPS